MQSFPKAYKLTCFETAHEKPDMRSFDFENPVWSTEGHMAGRLLATGLRGMKSLMCVESHITSDMISSSTVILILCGGICTLLD